MFDNDVKKIFASNIFALRKEKGLTQLELAENLDVSKTAVSEWESANKLPNAGSIEKISAFFNVPKSTLFGEGRDRFLSYDKMLKLPIVGRISCGNGSLAYEDIEGHEPTPEAWLNGGEYFYLRAKGDSMTGARIFDGDLVLIRQQPDVENGEIAAVLIDGEAYLKKITKHDNILILESANSTYPTKTYDMKTGDCKIIGKLKKIIVNL
ncbi:MAG: LexA repressor [Candidatus Dichloromethanomonas elyunquensis]|nr:MAG: LexA repressor [Candidatus Dichloromethanomonas elyunquensis]